MVSDLKLRKFFKIVDGFFVVGPDDMNVVPCLRSGTLWSDFGIEVHTKCLMK